MENHVSQEQISALVDQQLSDREAGAVQTHLSRCGTCRALYEDWSEVASLFQNAADMDPSPFLWQRIAAEIPPSPRPAPGNWFAGLIYSKPAWVAAGLTIIILAGALMTAEFRSFYATQLARQEALNDIETIRLAMLAMNGPNPETSNPFRGLLAANQNSNPFSLKRLGVEANPFRPVAAR